MKIIKLLSLSVSISVLTLLPTTIFSQIKTPTDNQATVTTNSAVTKYGALAIDRSNGFYFGWATDCLTLAEAEKGAIDECNKKGGRCTVVLSYSGTGCAAYRFITGNVGMGYGWGLARTKEEADAKAKKECAERSYGLPAPNFVYKCSSINSGNLTEIYNAHDEIISTQSGIITPY